MLAEREMFMVPDASANRPVPPVMVWVSVITTVGNTTMSPCPTTVTKNLVSVGRSPRGRSGGVSSRASNREVGTEDESPKVSGVARAIEMPVVAGGTC